MNCNLNVGAYTLSMYCASVFAFHKFIMSFEKLLFQMCEGFHFRKIVNCSSVNCISWIYSSSASSNSTKNFLNLIRVS
jgi:hypothetical protein